MMCASSSSTRAETVCPRRHDRAAHRCALYWMQLDVDRAHLLTHAHLNIPPEPIAWCREDVRHSQLAKQGQPRPPRAGCTSMPFGAFIGRP